jgi:hypothetical protein
MNIHSFRIEHLLYLGLEAERESEEGGERQADDIEGHQVGPRRQVLPPAAPGDAAEHPQRHGGEGADHGLAGGEEAHQEVVVEAQEQQERHPSIRDSASDTVSAFLALAMFRAPGSLDTLVLMTAAKP